MSEWTDELKKEIIDKYTAANPTPENSMEIVEALAEEYDKTPNGVRIILSKAEVYIKKNKTNEKKASAKEGGSKRVSKQECIDALSARIDALGGEVDEEILSKLTGKAAQYILNVINTVAA